uniref:Uncharacterized protein n=1 Tax=Plectus sambesii TaxID=2011161 RepID=A0A914W9J8_9BILA
MEGGRISRDVIKRPFSIVDDKQANRTEKRASATWRADDMDITTTVAVSMGIMCAVPAALVIFIVCYCWKKQVIGSWSQLLAEENLSSCKNCSLNEHLSHDHMNVIAYDSTNDKPPWSDEFL